ncbi:MAG: hypothetical protein HW419_1950, partial [Deltaproteobacteria bacterium]|nr:hypothetical protein [Deltaproteobacteria bacterium]
MRTPALIRSIVAAMSLSVIGGCAA